MPIQQNQKAQHLQQQLSEFKEEADIPFVLEDIRAVVSDSYHGLQRVKNIITDLKSFTHSQATELVVYLKVMLLILVVFSTKTTATNLVKVNTMRAISLPSHRYRNIILMGMIKTLPNPKVHGLND